ncbi:MAG: ATP-binding protein [Christensenellales bacterium]
MDYKKALNYIVNRRRDELAEADAFFKRLLASSPEFKDAELKLRAAELDFAKGLTSGDKVEAIRASRDAVIEKLNVKDKLTPPPRCHLCRDTGRYNGSLCRCVKKLAIEEKTDNVEFPLRSFSDLDPGLFEDGAKDLVMRTAAELKAIAVKGENAKRKNINLIGGTGTGKTFLASCFAGEVSALGRTVVFITAFTFVDRALKYHTTFDGGRAESLAPVLDCDALIIDDLGTESMFKNVTAEYLYHVINERQLKGRTTVITSNLTINEIAGRYGERIASRLFDKKLCYTREFTFADIRRLEL